MNPPPLICLFHNYCLHACHVALNSVLKPRAIFCPGADQQSTPGAGASLTLGGGERPGEGLVPDPPPKAPQV